MATETHEAAGHATEAVSAPGMPQLDFSNWGNQIFWLLITLVVIYLVLSRIALPRIAAVLSERQGTITNDLTKAEELKAKAIDAEEAYVKALADARAEAQRIANETKAEMQAELDASIAKADVQIAAKLAESEAAVAAIRATALDNIKDVAKETAAEIIVALGAEADAKTVDAAVAARIKG
ncbi:MAG: F0F1 ATP synthase subunit B' [Thalassovita sp.]